MSCVISEEVDARTEALTREEWDRRHHDPEIYTASQVSAILNENAYESAFTLYHKLRARMENRSDFEVEDTYPMRRGHALEHAMHWYLEQKGYEVHDPGDYTMIAHPEHPWFQCTIDRVIWERERVVVPGIAEMKSHGNWSKATREFLEDDPPLSVQLQIQTQMMITGVSWGIICADIGHGNPLTFEVTAHPQMQQVILYEVLKFREKTLRGIPPEVDGSASTFETLKKLHPEDNGQTVVVDTATTEQIAAYEHFGKEIKQLEKDRAEAKAKIVAAMKDNTFIVGRYGDSVYKYSNKTQTRRDSIKVDPEHEETLKQAGVPFKPAKETKFRVLRAAKIEPGDLS